LPARTSARPGILVHHALEVGEELRNPLHLIDDGADAVAAQEGDRVAVSQLALCWILERDVG
jgi:hypothetical protein